MDPLAGKSDTSGSFQLLKLYLVNLVWSFLNRDLGTNVELAIRSTGNARGFPREIDCVFLCVCVFVGFSAWQRQTRGDRHAVGAEQADRGPHDLRAGRRSGLAGAGPHPPLQARGRGAYAPLRRAAGAEEEAQYGRPVKCTDRRP